MAVKMIRKNDGIISLTFIRGDSCPLKFQIRDIEKTSVLKEGLQSLFLTCRKSNNKNSEIIFQKDINDFNYEDETGFYLVNIEPEDTRELPYDTYNFDIQATFSDGEVQTLKGEITLTDEDTIYEGG